MKYKVSRTSQNYFAPLSERKPCDEVFADYDSSWGEDDWYININTLEELHDFIKRINEDVMVSPPFDEKGCWHLWIDDEERR